MKLKKKITTDYDHDKYLTAQKGNKLTVENFSARLAQANLASKSDIANFAQKTDLNKNKLNELSKKLKPHQQKD